MNSKQTGSILLDGRFYGGAAVGVVILLALGFNWFGDYGFGWSLSSKTQKVASQAVEERLARICVARAHVDPEGESTIASMGQASSWKHRDLVTKRGWATIEPSDKPDRGVASRCAELLITADAS